MKPLSLAAFYNKKGLDLTCDQILELINDLGPQALIGPVVSIAHSRGISSQATTFKKMKALEVYGLIKTLVDKKDNRCRRVSITKAGLDRLKGWGA